MQLRLRAIVRARAADERGVTLVLMALLMVALLGMAGLVVNVGLVRADRQRNKSVADVSVAAGLRALNYGGRVAPFQGACEALGYLKTNHPELAALNLATGWSTGDGNPIVGSGDPCDGSSTAWSSNINRICNYNASVPQPSTARSTFAWFTQTTGDLDVKVRAGYAASDMAADNARDDVHNTDAPDGTKYGCDQLAVTITEREDAGFGRAVGVTELSSTMRSVGRVTVGTTADAAVGLLLLEPTGCNALVINGTGSNVRVLGTGAQPGIVHADSYGTTNCSGHSRVLEGHHTEGIVAKQSPSSPHVPGIVSSAALAGPPGVAARAFDNDPVNNVYAEGGAPEGRAPVGRGYVDERYRAHMASLDIEADTRMGWTNAQASANGYAVYSDCGAIPASRIIPDSRAFVRCDIDSPVTFSGADADIVVVGTIKLTSGEAVRATDPRTFYVYGETGGSKTGISLSGGELELNLGGAATCEARFAADRSKTTKFVLGHGSLDSSGGTLQLCSTTLLLADGSIPATDGTGVSTNGYAGTLKMTGASNVDWIAPNTTSVRSVAADWAKFEDLAFWTETSAATNLNGSGSLMTLKGVFFSPNADPFEINAGSGLITADAQFITRKLKVSGGGTLNMRANPEDSVLIPFVSGYRLVR